MLGGASSAISTVFANDVLLGRLRRVENAMFGETTRRKFLVYPSRAFQCDSSDVHTYASAHTCSLHSRVAEIVGREILIQIRNVLFQYISLTASTGSRCSSAPPSRQTLHLG